VGGGAAGVAAASESARRGARVTLFELCTSLPRPRSTWSACLTGGPEKAEKGSGMSIASLGVAIRTGEAVKKLSEDGTVATERYRAPFDSIVLATGGTAVTPDIPGLQRREGFHFLSEERSYLSLARSLDSYSMVSLTGTGPTALEVADRIAKRNIGLRIFAPQGILGPHLGELPRRRLESAISAAGVEQARARPERLVGMGAVEAVLADGVVYPCQAMVQIPRTEPNTLGITATLGRFGGVVVNDEVK
jgi:NADPH-dependent 2,4-dienoyl-CoA reductase/sulfur reductase-like enzyme